MRKNLNGILGLTAVFVFLAAIVYGGTWRMPVPAGTAVGDVIYADSESSFSNLADVAIGQVLTSGGVGTAPAWSASPTLTGITTTYLGRTPVTVSPTGTATYALSATSRSLVYINNASNSEVTVNEAGAVDGQELEIVNVSNGTCGFSDSAAVLELGAASRVLGIGDVLKLRYVVYPWSGGTNQWIEKGFSNN